MNICSQGRNMGAVSGKTGVQMHHLAHPLPQSRWEDSALPAAGGKVPQARFPQAEAGWWEGRSPQWPGVSWLTGRSPPPPPPPGQRCGGRRRSASWAASPSTREGMSGSREKFDRSWHTPHCDAHTSTHSGYGQPCQCQPRKRAMRWQTWCRGRMCPMFLRARNISLNVHLFIQRTCACLYLEIN